jgi:hypothetical protein
MTIEEFLLDRLSEAELICEGSDYLQSFQQLIIFGRAIVEAHKVWPTLFQGPLDFQHSYDPNNPDEIRQAVSQKIEWMTREEYFNRFGEEAPTAPFVQKMLETYKDHPDFNPEWLS